MPEISRAQYEEWRQPRLGRSNPERLDNPVWTWLVKSGLSAYQANAGFGCPGPFDEGWTGPGWCFDRMGCPRVDLPDGRKVWIAGEHEDSYDPDFFIYNDVVVQDAGGEVAIFGYPEEVFPPTDFHTATLDEGRGCIWIVGSLGHPEQRRPGVTPVFGLELGSFAIAEVAAGSGGPGWIHSHRARLEAGGARLILSRGICATDAGTLSDQIDDWALDLQRGSWERLSRRRFRQWELRRKDGGKLHLIEMLSLHLDARLRASGGEGLGEGYPDLLGDAREEIGAHFDPEIFTALYRPPVDFVALEDDEDAEETDWWDNTRFDEAKLRIGSCLARYCHDDERASVKLEGELPADIERALVEDLRHKLSKLHAADFSAECVASSP